MYCVIPVPLEPQAKVVRTLYGWGWGAIPRSKSKGKGNPEKRGRKYKVVHSHLATSIPQNTAGCSVINFTSQAPVWRHCISEQFMGGRGGRREKYSFACFTSMLSNGKSSPQEALTPPYLPVWPGPLGSCWTCQSLVCQQRGRPLREGAIAQERGGRNPGKKQKHCCLPPRSLMAWLHGHTSACDRC